MATETRSPDEIEREIEQERSDLSNTINTIQETFSADNIVRSVTDQFRRNGGDVGRSVAAAVRDNPMAVALTGVGLAWLIFGEGRYGPSGSHNLDTQRRRGSGSWLPSGEWLPSFRGSSDDEHSHARRHSASAGTVREPGIGPRSAVPAGRVPEWAREDHDDDAWRHSRPGSATRLQHEAARAGSRTEDTSHGTSGPSLGERASAGWSSAGAGLASGRDRVAGSASSAGRGLHDAGHRAGEGLRHRSDAMRQRLSHGTERMSEQARERVIAAREAALHTSESARLSMRRGGDWAADFYEDHPLVAGALAMAVGAALAGALPRTRIEDEYAGEESDRLFHEAERIFEEERRKVENVAGAALDEAERQGRSMRDDADRVSQEMKGDLDSHGKEGDSAADAAVHRVEDAARKVGETAQKKAEEENLGKSTTTS